MTTFDKREEGFEKKFALDEEQKFKAEARRNKLLGLWAAEQLGMSVTDQTTILPNGKKGPYMKYSGAEKP